MAEAGPSPTALFVTVGDAARRLLDASGALRDYPRRHGHEQARHLHLDVGRAGSRDAATLTVTVPDRLDQVAATSEYGRIYRRARTDVMALVRADPIPGTAMAHRLYVVAWAGQAGGIWPLLATLQVAQRLKGELRRYDLELDRYVLLTLPTGVDDRSVAVLGRLYATLLTLETARFQAEVVAGQVLAAPVAECVVAIGQGRSVPLPLDAQLQHAGGVLRLLADVGPLGSRVRAYLEQQRQSDASAGARIFTSIGVGSLVIEPDPVADLVTGLLLGAGDQAQRTCFEGDSRQ